MKRGVVMSLLMLVMKGRLKSQNALDLAKLKTILET
jgi:hypothetical protein